MIGWQGPGVSAGTRGRDGISGFDKGGFPESVEDRERDGEIYTYDVNTNTAAEAEAGVPVTGMQAVARFLVAELAKLRAAAAA